jgi:hypothetical protein
VIKYSHKENQSMMAPMTLQAYMLGLIQPNERLVYEKGGRGTATVIRLVRTDPETQHRHPQMRPQWVPEFGYNDGPSVVGNTLVAVSNTLYSMQQQRDGIKAQANEEHAVYWDTEADGNEPFGAGTARIIDMGNDSGVIAYTHKDNAHRIVMAIRLAEPTT